MLHTSPEEVVAEIEARAERSTTPSGDGVMVWRCWRAREGARTRPLVLLHGGAGSWRHWIRNIDALGRDRDVWAPDLPGFGDSARPAGHVNFAAVAKVVAAGIETKLPAETPFDLAGFSFGSHTSQYVAEELGAQVRTLVLVTAHMIGPMIATPNSFLERWRGAEDKAERDRIIKRNLGALMLAHEESMDALALHLYETDVLRARIRPLTFINERDFTMIERLPCRVAGIAGSLDPLGKPTPAAQGEVLLSKRPDARFHLFDNVGHWVPYEAAEQFNAVLRDVLDSP